MAKVDLLNNILVYSTYFGGSGPSVGTAIAVDSSGNAYVAGGTGSFNFPATIVIGSTIQPAFVAKFTPTGSLVYSTTVSGTRGAMASGVAVDSTGAVYLAGTTGSADFPVQNAFQTTLQGSENGYVLKLDPTASTLVYSTYLGGSTFDQLNGIAIDSSGNAFVVGATQESDFPLLNAMQPTFGGFDDVTLAKFGPTGTLMWSTYLGGPGFDIGSALALDQAGFLYVVGVAGIGFPTLNAFQSVFGGPPPQPQLLNYQSDAFLAKLNASSGTLVYSTYLGGDQEDFAVAVAVDAAGNPLVAGFAASTNFPVANPLSGSSPSNGGFLAKFDASGAVLKYSTFFPFIAQVSGLALDSTGAAVVLGVAQAGVGTLISPSPTGGGNYIMLARIADRAPLSTVSTVLTDADGIATSPPVQLPQTLGTSAILVTAPATGLAGLTFTVTSIDPSLASSLASPKITFPVSGMYLTANTPTISGTSSGPGLTVTVLSGGSILGTATTGGGGGWQFPLPAPLPSGLQTLSAFLTDSSGNTSPPSIPVAITVNTAAPIIKTSFPANQSTTSLRPTLSAQWSDAVSGVIPRTATITLDGINVTGYAILTAGGFSLVPPGTLTYGSHTVLVQVGDGAGLFATYSYSFTVTPQGPPPPPSGLNAQGGNGQVLLTWNVTAGATSYTLLRSTTEGGPYTVVPIGITQNFAIDTGLSNATTYYYIVSAVNAAGTGAPSNEAVATPAGPPAAPAPLTATGGNTQVLLQWTTSAGAVSYTVKKSGTSGGPYTPLSQGLTVTTFMDRGLQNGIAAYYVVSATGVGGESPNSSEASATPQALPNAPSNLTAIAADAQITLSWTGVAGATGYDVLRSTVTGGPYTSVGTPSGTIFTDTGLTNGIAYFYIVRSMIGSIEQMSDSNEASARPTLGPPTPEQVTAIPGSTQVTLSWVASAGATMYTIKSSGSSTGPFNRVAGTTSQPTFVDTPVPNGTAIYYVITATNGGGESPPSDVVAAIPIGAPTGLVAIPDSFPEVSLTWTPAQGTNVIGYNIYRSSQAGGPYAQLNIAAILTPSYLDRAVQFNTTFYYVVRALDSRGHESANSNEASATPAFPPLGLFGVDLTATSIDWNWYFQSAQDPSWNKFQLVDSNSNVITTTPDLTTTDYVEGGLSENTSYTRQIYAVTSSGALSLPSDPTFAYTLVHDATSGDFTVTASSTAVAVALTVTPPPNATADLTGVTIWRKGPNDSSFHQVVYLQGVYSYTDTGLLPGTPYTYAITYINGDGSASALSPPSQAVTTAPIPTNLAGLAQSTTSILWSWQAVVGANISYTLTDGTTSLPPTSVTSVFEQPLAENTLHTATVAANVGTGSPSSPASRYTFVHDAIQGDFSLAITGPTSVQVQVTPPPGSSTGMTGCEVSRSLDGSSWTVVQPFASTYSFPDGSLVGGTTYYYRIRFRNGDGVPAGYAPPVSVQTPPGPAAAPAGFSGIAQSTNQIHWTWGDVPGSSGFVLHDDNHQLIATVGAGVLFVDELGLLENVRTSRHVHALEGGFPGPASTTAAVYTLIHTASSLDFILTAFSQTRIDVLVQPPPGSLSGQTGCAVQRMVVGGTWTTIQAFASAYTVSDTALSPSTRYSYQIQFRNGDGIPSNTSSSQYMSTFSLPPPVILTPSKVTRSATPSIIGTANKNEILTIYYGTGVDGTTTADGMGNWGYTTGSNKSVGTYTVVAEGSSSGYSNSISIQVVLSTLPPPAPPTNLRYKSYATSSVAAIDLEWDASVSPNVAGYQVYRSTSPFTSTNKGSTINIQGIVVSTQFRDTGVQLNNTFYYQVTAVDTTVGD
ncbi:MAG TPA: SBBP repeat-containing protein [Planctomycetota bacterium]|nr:SBBP repeat-containing protein [Planctomycetota bacterium]